MAKKSENLTKKINPLLTKLAQDVKSTVRKDDNARASSRFALFLGAGASFSSGITIASGMIEHFKKEIFERYGVEFGNEKDEKVWLKSQDWYQKEGSDYSKLFEECYDTETKRRSYIESIIANAEPSFGYMVLANLIQEGYFKTVITTNFDDLVYIACTTFTSIRPVVYSLGGFATEMTLTTERPRVLKIHGDFLYSNLKNIGDELKYQDQTMAKEVHKVLEEYDGIIVVGYSGGDKSVMNLLKKIPKGKTLYWCSRKGSWLPQLVKNLISGNGKHLVEIDGFDDLLNFIREYIGISNQTLANNHKSNLDKMTNLLFKFEDASTISFVEEIAKNYQILSHKVYIDNAINNKDNEIIEYHCKKILELDPNDAIVYYNLGTCTEKDENRYKEAENYFIKAININPDDAEFHLALANLVAKDESRSNDAESIYQFIINNFPYFSKGYLAFGAFLAKNKQRLTFAEKLTRYSIRLNPNESKGFYNLGLILVNDKSRINEAEQSFLEAIKLNPNFADAYDNLGILVREHRNNLVEAEKLHRKAIELNSTSSNAYNNLGVILSFDKLREKEAEFNYRKAIELNPKSVSAYYNFGILLSDKTERIEEAKRLFEKTLEINPEHSGALNNLAGILITNNVEIKSAEVYLRKAIEIQPDFSEPYSNLGVLYDEKLNNRIEAEKFHLKAIEVNHNNSIALHNYANFLAQDSSRLSEAEENYRKAIKLDSLFILAYIGLGNLISRNSNRLKEAEEVYNQVIKIQPNYAEIYNSLGILFVKQNSLDKAISTLNKALELSPQNSNIIFSLAVSFKKLGSLKESKKLSKKGKLLIKDNSVYLLACYEAIMDNKELALDYLRQAVKEKNSIKISAKSDIEFDWIRDTPEFKKIVEE